jgi:hypothetical protein
VDDPCFLTGAGIAAADEGFGHHRGAVVLQASQDGQFN